MCQVLKRLSPQPQFIVANFTNWPLVDFGEYSHYSHYSAFTWKSHCLFCTEIFHSGRVVVFRTTPPHFPSSGSRPLSAVTWLVCLSAWLWICFLSLRLSQVLESEMVILGLILSWLMVEIRRFQIIWDVYCKNLVNNGINYLHLHWWSPDFWTIQPYGSLDLEVVSRSGCWRPSSPDMLSSVGQLVRTFLFYGSLCFSLSLTCHSCQWEEEKPRRIEFWSIDVSTMNKGSDTPVYLLSVYDACDSIHITKCLWPLANDWWHPDFYVFFFPEKNDPCPPNNWGLLKVRSKGGWFINTMWMNELDFV